MSEQQSDETYLASLTGAEWWAVLARGAFGFRYGPYTAEEAGKIMAQCVEEGVPLLLSANCGREFDWDVARDLARGQPANWRPMVEAPQDGTEIIAEVGGFETRIVWWMNWEYWREIDQEGRPGRPVEPFRWRPVE